MRRFALLLLMLGLLGVIGIGCDTSDDESGTVTLTGQVLDAETNNPIPNAFIRIVANEFFETLEDILVETDEEGFFSVDVKLDATTDIQIIASKDGFATDQISVLGIAGRVVEVPKLRIRRVRAEDPTSGRPSNILLLSQTQESISVIESGGQEVARITFQVADSAGRPVTLDQEALVRFSLGQHPDGGEFIAPTESETDNNGRVTVNLSSGNRAGVVQIVAETTTDDGTVIRSKPVSVTIHGGLPDQDHFTLGPAKFNFPGLNRAGLENLVSVIVGDKFANPVKPGTAVHFTANYAVIEGSVLTDQEGRGSVKLISANPLPPDGIGYVEAETANEDQGRVWSRFPVLFSGFPVITVEPATAILGQTYTLTVTDQNGNPLAEGTNIRVRAEGTKVKATGNTEVTLDDTIFIVDDLDFTFDEVVRGPGITEFTFRAVEDLRLDEDGSPTLETITILVSGPNGRLEVVLTAAGQVTPRTEGATVNLLSNGGATIRAAQ
ncbi:MAG: hypothetical protein ACE5G0_22055 [Rhodothermales bacterium]